MKLAITCFVVGLLLIGWIVFLFTPKALFNLYQMGIDFPEWLIHVFMLGFTPIGLFLILVGCFELMKYEIHFNLKVIQK